MKRPIFIIAIGFINGIIWGLLYNKAPILFIILICLNIIIRLLKFSKTNHFLKIYKIFNNTLLLFVVISFISSYYIIFLENRYTLIYNNFKADNIIATVVSNNKNNDYKNIYKVKVENYKKDMYCILKIPKNIELDYGDKIQFKGEYVVPEEARNYGGFNYRKYLKTQKVYGTIETDNVYILKKSNLSIIRIYSNFVKNKIISNVNVILPKETKELFLGILIGYDENLQEGLQESFNKSSLSHLLAVSGTHIAYIIIGLDYIFLKLSLTKRIRNYIIILFLIFFMYITDFSSSVVRASIMGIISLCSLLVHRKSNIKSSMSLSILLILLNNPYKILDVGLRLSYLATVGIIVGSKSIFQLSKDDDNILIKIKRYIKNNILITIFANIFVIPIMIYNFNTYSLTFIISNVVASLIIGPITIGGFILIVTSFVCIKLASIISILYNLLLNMLILTTTVVANLPLSQVIISTPDESLIIFYYIILSGICILIMTKNKYSNRYLFHKIYEYLFKLFKVTKEKIKIIITFNLIFIILIACSFKLPHNNLKIYFIDVGQGDSTLIITPRNKKILIDGGGAETGNFDVGKRTLLPYLLDRNIISLDYVFISHFDTDHCKRIVLFDE